MDVPFSPNQERDIVRLERLLWVFAVRIENHFGFAVRPEVRPDSEMMPAAARLWDITGALAMEIVEITAARGPR